MARSREQVIRLAFGEQAGADRIGMGGATCKASSMELR